MKRLETKLEQAWKEIHRLHNIISDQADTIAEHQLCSQNEISAVQNSPVVVHS